MYNYFHYLVAYSFSIDKQKKTKIERAHEWSESFLFIANRQGYGSSEPRAPYDAIRIYK